MAKTIRVFGTRYRILPLAPGGPGDPLYLLRNDPGELFALYGSNGEPSLMRAWPLSREMRAPNPLARVQFHELNGRLIVGG